MTADVATPQPKQPSAASSHTAAAPDGRTDGAPTPFYNHLMSMIDATVSVSRYSTTTWRNFSASGIE